MKEMTYQSEADPLSIFHKSRSANARSKSAQPDKPIGRSAGHDAFGPNKPRLTPPGADVARGDKIGNPPYQLGLVQQRRVTLIRHHGDVDLAAPRQHRTERGRGQHIRPGAANNHQWHSRQRVEVTP